MNNSPFQRKSFSKLTADINSKKQKKSQRPMDHSSSNSHFPDFFINKIKNLQHSISDQDNQKLLNIFSEIEKKQKRLNRQKDPLTQYMNSNLNYLQMAPSKNMNPATNESLNTKNYNSDIRNQRAQNIPSSPILNHRLSETDNRSFQNQEFLRNHFSMLQSNEKPSRNEVNLIEESSEKQKNKDKTTIPPKLTNQFKFSNNRNITNAATLSATIKA